ncbi:MAG: hypothetical protein JXR94_21105, partial [Candidatus Hydrogenedentes bacterium]|nr:hypothetical protein [Candidatus Hydrogenedentota bacterium]
PLWFRAPVAILTLAACARLLFSSVRGLLSVLDRLDQLPMSAILEGMLYAAGILVAVWFPLNLAGLFAFVRLSPGLRALL